MPEIVDFELLHIVVLVVFRVDGWIIGYIRLCLEIGAFDRKQFLLLERDVVIACLDRLLECRPGFVDRQLIHRGRVIVVDFLSLFQCYFGIGDRQIGIFQVVDLENLLIVVLDRLVARVVNFPFQGNQFDLFGGDGVGPLEFGLIQVFFGLFNGKFSSCQFGFQLGRIETRQGFTSGHRLSRLHQHLGNYSCDGRLDLSRRDDHSAISILADQEIACFDCLDADFRRLTFGAGAASCTGQQQPGDQDHDQGDFD